MADRDHDIVVRDADGHVSSIVKGDTADVRPHAASCVGCRREGICVGCGGKTSAATGRCTSGACPSCCWKIHKHPNS